MSLAEGLAMARASLELIAELSTEEPVKRQVAKAISMLDRLAREEAGRKAAEAERKRNARAAKKPPEPPASADTPPRPRTSADAPGRPRTWGEGGQSVNGSTKEHSHSGFPSSNPERESGTRPVASADVRGRAALPHEQIVTLTTPITPELHAIASLQAVQDIAGAWTKFCGYFNGQAIDVAGRWQMWSVDTAKRERTERERARRQVGGRPVPVAGDGSNPNPVSRDFELTPFDEARIAAARADREQDVRADVASTRPSSEPTAAFGGKR